MKNLMKTVAVIVVVMSPMFSQTGWAGPKDRQARPSPMGVSISTTPSSPFIFAGTAGMRVRSLYAPDIKFILSNNHVMGAVGPELCPDTADRGTWVLQPGTLDIGSDPGESLFYLAGLKFAGVPIDFSFGASNLVDAAIAITSETLADRQILDLAPGFPTPQFTPATLGMSVTKSGRTTGVTLGTVQSLNTTVFVNYGAGCGTARFVNQIVVTPGNFIQGGDSGSVALETATGIPVGLLFAGSATQAIMNPILLVYLLLGVFVD